MTNSQVKQAIDETIGRQPLMDEAFVQKVLDGKQHRKKELPFIQPAIVLLLAFVRKVLEEKQQHKRRLLCKELGVVLLLLVVVGGMRYVMPQLDEQMAVDSEDESVYLANPEHFNDMMMQNRRDSRLMYVFNNG